MLALVGKKFGRLKVLERVNAKGLSEWLCACSCGKRAIVKGTYLSQGQTKSCGCLRRQWALKLPALRHGMTRMPEYKAFKNAQNRCKAKSGRAWKYYGSRGVKFLFKSFEQWFEELGRRPSPKHSVHRVKPAGNYVPGNVKWATSKEQNRNRRTA